MKGLIVEVKGSEDLKLFSFLKYALLVVNWTRKGFIKYEKQAMDIFDGFGSCKYFFSSS